MRRWFSLTQPRLWLSISALTGTLVLWSGCAGVRPEPTFRSRPPGREVATAPERSAGAPAHPSARKRMAQVIREFLGAPYVWGGRSPQGVDCSGLVVAIYGRTFDMDLPHSAAALYRMGVPVSRRQLRFGDLVFFSTRGDPAPEHVGIYLDKGLFVHASRSQGVVVERLSLSYYKRRWVGARRLVSF